MSPATLVVWLRRALFVASALAVVCPLGQSHGNAHPCIPQVSTEASLPSPPCGPRDVFATEMRPHEVLNNMRELSCAGFRHTAGFHARVILDGVACRLGELGDVHDPVVPVVLRVLGVVV